MLARLSTLVATGIYGAAYRIVDVSFSPVSSLLYAAYPSFFRAGMGGIAASCKYARPLLIRSLGFSFLICTAILLFAGVVPRILGAQYAATAEALRWLSFLPILKSVHYFLSDVLTSAGHQAVRTVIQIGVALFNILINLWVIPAYSWRGAAVSSIARRPNRLSAVWWSKKLDPLHESVPSKLRKGIYRYGPLLVDFRAAIEAFGSFLGSGR
jgi:O-antigen/teichoic acid export membrane protein